MTKEKNNFEERRKIFFENFKKESPVITQELIAIETGSFLTAPNKSIYETYQNLIFKLEQQDALAKGIKLYTSQDNKFLIRDAREQPLIIDDKLASYHPYAMSMFNIARTAEHLIDLDNVGKDLPTKMALMAIKKNIRTTLLKQYNELQKTDTSQKDWKKNTQQFNNIIIDLLKQSGSIKKEDGTPETNSSKIKKILNKAKDFSNFDTPSPDIVTITKMADQEFYSFDFKIAPVTETIKKDYNAIAENTQNHSKLLAWIKEIKDPNLKKYFAQHASTIAKGEQSQWPEWAKKIKDPNIKKLLATHAATIAEGEHVIPNQLTMLPGARNAYRQQVVTIKEDNTIDILSDSIRSGTPANDVGGNHVDETLKALQAAVPDYKLQVVSLMSPNTGNINVNEKGYFKQIEAAGKETGISVSKNPFNMWQIFNFHNNHGIKLFLHGASYNKESTTEFVNYVEKFLNDNNILGNTATNIATKIVNIKKNKEINNNIANITKELAPKAEFKYSFLSIADLANMYFPGCYDSKKQTFDITKLDNNPVESQEQKIQYQGPAFEQLKKVITSAAILNEKIQSQQGFRKFRNMIRAENVNAEISAATDKLIDEYNKFIDKIQKPQFQDTIFEKEMNLLKSLLKKQIIATSCKSGKDRTGYKQSREQIDAIAENIATKFKDRPMELKELIRFELTQSKFESAIKKILKDNLITTKELATIYVNLKYVGSMHHQAMAGSSLGGGTIGAFGIKDNEKSGNKTLSAAILLKDGIKTKKNTQPLDKLTTYLSNLYKLPTAALNNIKTPSKSILSSCFNIIAIILGLFKKSHEESSIDEPLSARQTGNTTDVAGDKTQVLTPEQQEEFNLKIRKPQEFFLGKEETKITEEDKQKLREVFKIPFDNNKGRNP